jgi:hypothetical protein
VIFSASFASGSSRQKNALFSIIQARRIAARQTRNGATPPDGYFPLFERLSLIGAAGAKCGRMRLGMVPMQNHLRVACGALLLAVFAPLLAGCDEPTSARAATEIVPSVGIITVKSKPRALVRELPGRIAPTRLADVRPRISGIVV